MQKIGAKTDEVRIDGNLSRFRKDLEYFAEIGLDATEIPVHGLDAIKKGNLDRRRLAEVGKILEDFDFIYSVHAPNPLNLMEREHLELHIAVFRASLEFASAIGSKIVVYHPGRFVAEETFLVNGLVCLDVDERERMLDKEAHILSILSEEHPDTIICMENARPYLFHSPYCYAEIPDLLAAQVLRINRDNIRINLDFGHLYMASRFYGFDPVEKALGIRELIAHTHIHDNFGDTVYAHEKQQTHQIPFGRGDSHMPVGWGEIPIKELLSPFAASYEGIYMMELRSRYFEHIIESKENLEGLLLDLTKT